MEIPSIDYDGNGPDLLFLHANGYPPDCYRPLLMQLSENYRVTAMVQRPLWPESDPKSMQDWRLLTEDLLTYLDTHTIAPITCVGHSMGGIALLRAALREPERFKAIVLLDPVLFPPVYIFMWRLLFKSGLGHLFHPLVANAKQRRRQFDDLDRLFRGYRRRSVFKYMDDDALRCYVQGITCPLEDGGYELCYSPEWEVRIYVTGVWSDMDIWRKLPSLTVPTLIIRGAETDTFHEKTARLVKRKQPRVHIESLENSTHLIPLERPREVSERIRSFFEEKV